MKFGDIIENHYASENNPQRKGIFVRQSGGNIEVTDGKGDFWKTINDKESQTYVIGNIIDQEAEKRKEVTEQAEVLFDTVQMAIYELEALERNLDMPAKGYVRNCYNRVMRTLQEGVQNGVKDPLFNEIAEKDKEIKWLREEKAQMESSLQHYRGYS